MFRLPTDEDGGLIEQQIQDVDLLLLQKAQEGEEEREALTVRRAELVASLPDVSWLRVTARELSRMDFAHYDTLWDDGRAWFLEQTGREVTDDLDEQIELSRLRRAVLLRAGMLASVKRTTDYKRNVTTYHAETCTLPAGKTPGPSEVWEEGSIPAAWTTIDGMCYEMPMLLFGHWAEAAHTLNAGILPLAPDFLAGSRIVTKRLTG